MIDLAIVVAYFLVIFWVAIKGRIRGEVSVDNYFLGNRSLKWYSIALSTIATNIQGYHFLGMMGSAYLYGLAQAHLEIDAIQGILFAAFLFVPMFLKARIITVTQFIEQKVGKLIARIYSLSYISFFATLTLGAALFWGAYAAEVVFSDYLLFIHDNQLVRIGALVVGLGSFSAIYTYLGGLNAVVKTDIIQFLILVAGGITITFIIINELGGWSMLYEKTGDKMHLMLPADHPTLPWTLMLGLFFLNINYWCANQSLIQRSLAARNLKEAQKGLMVGGLLKYLMAVIVIIPGIALYGILGVDNGLTDPDNAFPYLVSTYLPVGVQGLVLCALFASLMSTVDSTFNSIATLWSVDIFRGWIKPHATEKEMVDQGKKAILLSLFSGVMMGLVLMYLKFENPESAFTHTLNDLRYYIFSGFTVIICSVVLLNAPNRMIVLLCYLVTIPLNLALRDYFPDMNYFFRVFWVIFLPLLVVIATSFRGGWTLSNLSQFEVDRRTKWQGILLGLSLILVHLVFR